MILEERLELSRKWRIPGKTFYTLANAKTLQIKVPEYLEDRSRDSEIRSSDILEVC